MATIASLIVEISAKSIKLKSGLTKATSKIKAFAKRSAKVLAGIGAAVGAGAVAGIAAVIKTVNKYAAQIDKLAKTSSKLGITVDALQKLEYQAELTGVSSDTLSTALQRMVRRVSEAAKGTGAAKDALKELNINAEELNKLSPDKQFYAISEAMKGISSQGDKVRLAMKIFDTEGVSLVNTMSGNLNKMGEEFDSLGLSITQSGARMVEAYNDSKSRLSKIFEGFGNQLTVQLAEPFTMIVNYISKVITEMGGMEAVANKVALSMVEGLRGVVDVINDMIKGISDFQLLSKKTELKGAEHRGAIGGGVSDLTGGYFGDATGNKSNIDRIKKEIEALEKPITSLSKIDDFIAKMQKKIADNQPGQDDKIDMSDVINPEHYKTSERAANDADIIKPEHYKAFDKAANDADIMARSTSNAAQKTNDLANAATKAAQAIAPKISKDAKSSASLFDGSISNSISKGYSQPGFSAGGGPGIDPNSKVGSIQDYINQSPAGKKMQEMREGGAFGGAKAGAAYMEKQKSLGKIDINMQTDAGKISGQLFGEPSFLNSLKSFNDKTTNQSATMAAM